MGNLCILKTFSSLHVLEKSKETTPKALWDGHVIIDSINTKVSLAQGDSHISFMICVLVEIAEDMVELELFESVHLRYDFPVVVSQLHVIGGLLQIESLNDNSRITNDNQILDGEPYSLT